jgi:predicted transcriptional regulator YheO
VLDGCSNVTTDHKTQSQSPKTIKTQTGQYLDDIFHPILRSIHQVMPSLAKVFGPDCELVLHDFKDVRHSIIAIEGNVTGRSVGGPLTDLFLQVIRMDESPPDMLKYPSFTVDGRELVCSTIFLRDEADKVVGCLCINRDVRHLKLVRDSLNELCEAQPVDEEPTVEGTETFVQDVEELLMGSIHEVIAIERKPIEFMTKPEKTRIVKMLDDRGIFLIRGSVQTVARALNVSRYTIYNYLEEVRQTDSTEKTEG